MSESDERLTIKAGTLLTFEHGEYSDFSYTGPFRVEKDIDREREASAFRSEFRPKWEGQMPDYGGFVPWLARNGFISDIESTSWHIGSYGEFDPV